MRLLAIAEAFLLVVATGSISTKYFAFLAFDIFLAVLDVFDTITFIVCTLVRLVNRAQVRKKGLGVNSWTFGGVVSASTGVLAFPRSVVGASVAAWAVFVILSASTDIASVGFVGRAGGVSFGTKISQNSARAVRASEFVFRTGVQRAALLSGSHAAAIGARNDVTVGLILALLVVLQI